MTSEAIIVDSPIVIFFALLMLVPGDIKIYAPSSISPLILSVSQVERSILLSGAVIKVA